jgi:hypothetical protein
MFSSHSSMKECHQLMRDGFGLGYNSYAHPPTVTLPRIKVLLTLILSILMQQPF